jgi:hypothetical protein
MPSENLDISSEHDLIKQLSDVGLTDKEARVYLALLSRQNVGSSKLIAATGLHGQFVYDALARLEQLGLAKHVIQNGRKKFSPNYGSKLQTLFSDRVGTSKFIHQLIEEITVYSRPIRDKDPVAGPKKEGQLIPHKIHIKFKLPADILNDLPITSARYRSPTGAG